MTNAASVCDADRRRSNVEAVAEAFAGVGNADAGRQLAQYTDDLVLELPFADPPRRVVGKKAAMEMLSTAFEIYKMTLAITSIHECLDPDELVIEFVSEGVLSTTGRRYANTYVAIFRFRDGKICHQREFFDPLITQRALEM